MQSKTSHTVLHASCNLLMDLTLSCRAREALVHSLPEALRNNTFSKFIDDDASIKRCLVTLLSTLGLWTYI